MHNPHYILRDFEAILIKVKVNKTDFKIIPRHIPLSADAEQFADTQYTKKTKIIF